MSYKLINGGGNFMRDRSNTSKFHLDGIPPLREAFPLGLQHVIAMFVPNLVPMMLVSQAAGLDHFHTTLLIQCAMIGAAIGTLLQEYPISLGKEYRIGSKLPVMLGLTYVFMPTCIAVAGQHGMATIFGAQIVAGLISIIFGVVFKKVRKYFPPVVTGTVVLSLGLSVFSLAINNIAGGASSTTYGSYQNWIVGMTVVVIVLFLQQWGKGLLKDSAILVGMLAGYIVAFGFNMIDFSPIAEAAWFAFPKPLAFGLDFRLDVIVMFVLLYFIVSVQIVGDFSVSAMGGLGREATDEELTGGIIGNSFSSAVTALLNNFPTATYSQNSGLVALNKVVSRYVLGVGAVILLIAGLCPKVGAAFSTIPNPVVGGGTLVVFSMIAMSGISLVNMQEFGARSKLIVGISLAFGLGVVNAKESIAMFPETFKLLFGQSSVVLATTIAVILNLIFPKEKEDAIEVRDKSSKKSIEVLS